MPALRCRRCKPLHAPCMCVAARQMLPQTLAIRYAALGHRRIALRSALGAAAPKATRLPATGLGGSRSTARPARVNAENKFPRVHRWPVAHKHVAASNQSLAADSRATEGAACLAPAPGRYVFSFPCATSLPHVPPADAAQQSRNPCAPAGAPRTHPPPETHTRSLKSHSLKSCGTGRPERRPPAHASPAADHPLRPSVLPAVCCGSDRFHHAAPPRRPPPTSAASGRLHGSRCRASPGAGHRTVRCSDAPDGNVAARISRHKRVLGSRGERAHWRVVAEQRRRRLRQKARRRYARAPAADQLHSRWHAESGRELHTASAARAVKECQVVRYRHRTARTVDGTQAGRNVSGTAVTVQMCCSTAGKRLRTFTPDAKNPASIPRQTKNPKADE